MNLRTFQQFDPWGNRRFMRKVEKRETPPPTPAGAPPAPARTPEQDAAARAQTEAEGQARAAAAQRTDQAPEQADAALDAALGGGGAAAQAPAAPRESAEAAETLPSIENIMKIIKKPAAERTAEEKKICEAVEFAFYEITQKEQDEFRKQYTKEGKLDLPIIGTKIKNGTLTTKELLILMSLVSDADVEELTKKSGLTAEQIKYGKEIYQSLQAKLETKRKLDRFDALIKDDQYAKEYKKFKESITQAAEKSPDELEKIKQDFLAVFKDPKDKEIVEWGINTEPSAFEKAYVLKNKLKGAKLSDEDIKTQLSAGTLNFREAQIAMALNHEGAPEGESQIPDSVKGLGFMAILEKLIDQLSKLAEKISGALEKAFAKKDQPSEKPRFAKSPFGEDKKFKLKKTYEEGKGVAFEAPKDTQIFSVEPGKIRVSDNVVAITTSGGGRIEYRNMKAEEGINGTTIEAGKPIGKAGEQGFVELRAFNNENKEGNPTAFLEPYLTAEEMVAQAPATPAPAPPPAPTTPPPPPSKPS